MLAKELLEGVRTVIAHRNSGSPCPDGVASAIILNDVFEDVELKFMAHGSPEYLELKATEGMLFVDITPPEGRVGEFVAAGAIVLDHHSKQADIVQRFGSRGIYCEEPGVSGAMLAFREVWLGAGNDRHSVAATRAYSLARLAGIRDTWQTHSAGWQAACSQAEALAFYPWKYLAEIRMPFTTTGWNKLTQYLAIGDVLIYRRAESVQHWIAEGSGRPFGNNKRMMIIPTLETSDVAEAMHNMVDLVVGFQYRGGENIALQLSMRSYTGYDVGALCKTLGGGGHTAAAGAQIPVRAGDVNAYELIWKIVDAYESANQG